MGCDIHMYVEYKQEVKKVEKWFSGDYFKFNIWHGEFSDESLYSRIELHGNRNYSLFSTLAGVRDYSDKVIPVSEPKGVPENCCQYVKEENEQWEGDGHTHSWLTLKELKDYQEAAPKMHYTGLISRSAQVALDTEGKTPDSWCQGTNQEGYERREWSEENKTLVPLIEKLQKRAHELLQHDWEEYKSKNDENVRIVFWFDN